MSLAAPRIEEEDHDPGREVASARALAGDAATFADSDCLHCGLPLPRLRRRRANRFCCDSCAAVYSLLHDESLARYYDLRRGPGVPATALKPDAFAWLDLLVARAGGRDGASVVRLTLDVQGIHCTACVWLLQELYRRRAGGLDIRVNPALGRAELAWDASRGELIDYLRDAERFGYRFGPVQKDAPVRSRALLLRLAICTAAAMNVMILSLAFYLGLTPDEGPLYTIFGRAAFIVATIGVGTGAWVFVASAARGLARGIAHLDLPIAAGAILAWGGSTWAYFTRGPEAAYFDTVSVFVALMVFGRWLQERVLERNRSQLLATSGIDALCTRRRESGTVNSIPVAAVRKGDEIWVVPGDLVPAQGELLDHRASLALDWITGESAVETRHRGEAIPAGAINAGSSAFRVITAEDFASSRLVPLLRDPAPRSERVAPAKGFRGRVGLLYVGAVFAIAAAAFLSWFPRDAGKALGVAVAVLTVTCPCAIGLGIPLAHELVYVALRRRGVFLRDGTFLARAIALRKVLFDKTGTVTLGRLALRPGSLTALDSLDRADAVALYNMTIRSNHPVASALARACVADAGDAEVVEIAGQGLESRRNGHVYRLGRATFATAAPQPGVDDAARDCAPAARASFTRDGALLAAFECDEELREDARAEVRRLEAAGLEVHLLSGDSAERTAAVARELDLAPERARGALTPEEKAVLVAAIDARDTLMVGDGLNDGPSLDAAWAAATPAIDRPAIPARVDFYFVGDRLSAVRRAILAARDLRGVIRRAIVVAAVYNAVAVTLAVTGRVTPLLAAFLMPASSITIVALIGWRLTGRRLAWMS